VIWKALEKDVEKRYQSMNEVREDLVALLSDPSYVPEPLLAAEVSEAAVESRAANSIYMIALALLLCLGGVMALVSPRSPLKANLAAIAATRGVSQINDERAMREALVSFAKKLYKDGKGKEAQEVLKQVIQENQRILPPNDPALRDMQRLESVLNKKNR
jgi:hypothetical protein